MHAKVTVEFPGRPDDEVVSRLIQVGEVIRGDLARVAVVNKWAREVPPNTKSDSDEGESDLMKELKGKTVEQLKALAAEKKIDLGAASKKAAILAVPVEGLEEPEEQQPAA